MDDIFEGWLVVLVPGVGGEGQEREWRVEVEAGTVVGGNHGGVGTKALQHPLLRKEIFIEETDMKEVTQSNNVG